MDNSVNTSKVPNHIDEHKDNNQSTHHMRTQEGLYDYAKRVGIDTEKIDTASKISSEPDLTPKPHILYAEFSEMRSKYYNLEDKYNKLQKNYGLLLEDYERLKPNSENHHMILDIHPYCDKCLKFKPVVKKYIDISEENINIYGGGHIDPIYDIRESIKGNTIVSCEYHDTCSMMYDYIYEHFINKPKRLTII